MRDKPLNAKQVIEILKKTEAFEAHEVGTRIFQYRRLREIRAAEREVRRLFKVDRCMKHAQSTLIRLLEEADANTRLNSDRTDRSIYAARREAFRDAIDLLQNGGKK